MGPFETLVEEQTVESLPPPLRWKRGEFRVETGSGDDSLRKGIVSTNGIWGISNATVTHILTGFTLRAFRTVLRAKLFCDALNEVPGWDVTDEARIPKEHLFKTVRKPEFHQMAG